GEGGVDGPGQFAGAGGLVTGEALQPARPGAASGWDVLLAAKFHLPQAGLVPRPRLLARLAKRSVVGEESRCPRGGMGRLMVAAVSGSCWRGCGGGVGVWGGAGAGRGRRWRTGGGGAGGGLGVGGAVGWGGGGGRGCRCGPMHGGWATGSEQCSGGRRGGGGGVLAGGARGGRAGGWWR